MVRGQFGVERRCRGRDIGIAVLAALVGATSNRDESVTEKEWKRTSGL